MPVMRALILLSACALVACGEPSDTLAEDALPKTLLETFDNEPAFLDPDTLSRTMFSADLVALDGMTAELESDDMTQLMTPVVSSHPGDAGVQQVFAGDGRTIVFLDESFDTGPLAMRETYAEFLPVGPLTNRLEFIGARVKCRGATDFQLEPCT